MGLLDTKYCTCGYELTAEKLLHTIWLDGRGVEIELCVCPRCGRYSFYQPGEARQSRYRAECGGKTDEELNALLESSDTHELMRDAAREILTSRAEWRAVEQRRQEKEAAREQESAAGGGFFSGLFGRKDEEDKARKNRPPEF